MKTQETINHITNWLNNYCDQTNMDGFIVGISGGVDSAVTSTLCALTGKKVYCLNIPIHQNKQQFSLAEQHIFWLKSKFNHINESTIDLTTVFDQYKLQLPNDVREDHLSMANLRSRLRMSTLYAVGQSNKLLVAGTGNKVEDFGIGFFTKYGDGGVDISPIADLMKSEVYLLAETLGILNDIVNARPTDGLWENDRTDEDQIGASYNELEWAMNFSGNTEQCSEREKEVMAIYLNMNKINKHKMVPIPVCTIPDNLR